MPRLFIGLELSDAIVADILALQERIPGARWQSATQLHLTLVFIGQVESATKTVIAQALRRVRQAPLTIQLRAPECPGNPLHRRHLWLPAEPSAELMRLHTAITGQLENLGLTLDPRHFRPHVTLARLSKRAETVGSFLATHAQWSGATFTADHITLFNSTPQTTGSSYDVLERFALVCGP